MSIFIFISMPADQTNQARDRRDSCKFHVNVARNPRRNDRLRVFRPVYVRFYTAATLRISKGPLCTVNNSLAPNPV